MRLSRSDIQASGGTAGGDGIRTQRIGAGTRLPGLLRSFGVEPADLLTDLGLAADALDHPDKRMPVDALGPLYEACVARPTSAPYQACFGPRLRFDAPISLIRFPVAWLARPLSTADPARRRRLEAEAGVTQPAEHLVQIERTLMAQMLAGATTDDALADALAMHRRTLDRRLADLGVSFQGLLDSVRFDLARQLLSATRLSLAAIAQLLGYAGVPPFLRAFRRWSGTTPGR